MLVIDDEHAIRSVLSSLLTRAGYDVLEVGHVAEAWKQLLTHDVDVMICDVRLPDGSGVDLVRATCAQLPDVAVVMLTGVDDPVVAAEVFQLGAAAYLVKPFGSNEILINVANALRLRDLERARRAHEYEMERKLLSRNQALTAVLRRVEAAGVRTALDDREAADRLAAALSLRHEETGRHIERVGIYAGLLAAAGGWTDWTPEAIRIAAMLHDVGKLGIPDAILTSTGPLDEEQMAAIRRHPELGHALLVGSVSPVVALGASTALTHHERWDGDGYPQGLARTAITLEGRIAALADVFDAMTSHRSYHDALSVEQAVDYITVQRGRHFDPTVVDLFLGMVDDFAAVRLEHPDPAPPRRTTVLVVDDHRMFAESLQRLLARDLGLSALGTAGTVTEAIDLADRHQPDVVLMDLQLPDGDGLEATVELRRRQPRTQVVLLSGREDPPLLADALRAGCAGYLPKTDALDQLTRVVRQAADGEPILPSGVMPQVLSELQHDALRRTGTLTSPEVEVLGHLARGLGIDAVADQLGISSSAVQVHVDSSGDKLGGHTRLDVVVAAVRQGLVRPG